SSGQALPAGSTWQVESQQSPGTRLPSSQVSPSSRTPLPQGVTGLTTNSFGGVRSPVLAVPPPEVTVTGPGAASIGTGAWSHVPASPRAVIVAGKPSKSTADARIRLRPRTTIDVPGTPLVGWKPLRTGTSVTVKAVVETTMPPGVLSSIAAVPALAAATRAVS